MDKKEILNLFKDTGAILEGHFLLSSGLHSEKYMQCAILLSHPDISEKVCSALADKCKIFKPNVVIAPALGGVIVSYEVARALGVKSLFTERNDGKMTLRRGFTLNDKDRVLVVEDVMTTGRSISEVIDVVKECGAKVVGIACIVDRSSGKLNFSYDFVSLLKIDIPVYSQSECPLCKKSIPFQKPGSRKF